MSFLKKHQASGGPLKPASQEDAAFKTKHPALFEYLTLRQYPDGSNRQTASLSVFHEDGLWKACLNERDTGLVLFVAEERHSDLLDALELLLQEDRPPWRPSKSKGQNRGREKGKGT